MTDAERCINVDLSEQLGEMCLNIAMRAVKNWRTKGIDELQIQHSFYHPFPAIWSSFATEDELLAIREQAATELGVDISQILVDEIRKDGLVNLCVEW
jgi:hypothetical protein